MSKTILATIVVALAAACGGAGASQQHVTDDDVRQALSAAGIVPPLATTVDAPALVELGRMLFFDKILSGNRNISCATCHHPSATTGDALPLSIGPGGVGLAEDRVLAEGTLNPRNALPLFNLGEGSAHALFWDGRVSREPGTAILNVPDPNLTGASIDPAWRPYTEQLLTPLAAQAMFPVTLAAEMRGAGTENELASAPDNRAVWERLMLRLGAYPDYVQLFLAAYPAVAAFDDLNFAHAARAIAAFERAAYTQLDTPLDRYLAGEPDALSDSAKRGAVLFCGPANCTACHRGEHLTDWDTHAIAAPQLGPGTEPPLEDRGRFRVTSLPEDLYAFRTPPLRNVALTGPWTHAGAYATLEGVVRHHLDPVAGLLEYDATQLPASLQTSVDVDPARNAARLAAVSPLLGAPLVLTDAQVTDLVAFLHALTSPSSLALLADIPDTVPSGLPVAD